MASRRRRSQGPRAVCLRALMWVVALGGSLQAAHCAGEPTATDASALPPAAFAQQLLLPDASRRDRAGGTDPPRVVMRALLRFYKATLTRVDEGIDCPYDPGCSSFAMEAAERYKILALPMIADRLTRCHGHQRLNDYERAENGMLVDPPPGARLATLLPLQQWAAADREARRQFTAFAQAQAPSPKQLRQQLALAQNLFTIGEFREARTEFLRALALGAPQALSAKVWIWIGACGTRLREWERAREDVQFAVTLDSSVRPFAAYQKAIFLWAKGDPRAAATQFLEAAQSPGASPEVVSGASLMRLWCLLLSNQLDACRREAQKLAQDSTDKDLAGAATKIAATVADTQRKTRKSPVLSGILSAIVPGAGQLYSGRTQDALASFLWVAALSLATAEASARDARGWAAATGTLAGTFYLGNIYGATRAPQYVAAAARRDMVDELSKDIGGTVYRLTQLLPPLDGGDGASN